MRTPTAHSQTASTMASPPVDLSALQPQVTTEMIAGIADRIVQTFDPEAVILFGSHASGAPLADSDVDILVIMESTLCLARRIEEVARTARVRFLPMDVLVFTPGEVEDRLSKGDFFMNEILGKGKVLYQRGPR